MFARILLEVCIVVFIVSEVAIPLFRGTPLFPMFRRKRQAQLLSDLEQARQDLAEDNLEEKVAQLRAEHEKRHPKVPEPEKEQKSRVF